MRQLLWGGKFITEVRAGLSVAVLVARRRESLHRKADEVRLCAYSCSSEEIWTRIIRVNVENVNKFSRTLSLSSTFLNIYTRAKYATI
jgi:hypothetical protein